MFSMAKILLPVDFSERSVGAARYAEAIAAKHGSEITLLHVVPPPHYEFTAMEAGSAALAELYSNRKAMAEKECQEFLKSEIPGVRRLLTEGDPAREIIRIAHDEGMNLIVLPTHGYGPFRRFILGSVTAKVLHDADCPVLTGIHLEEAPAIDTIHFRTVLAALDFGPQSEKTLLWAQQFACSHAAKLFAVHATPNLEGSTGEYFDPEWRKDLAAQAAKEMERLLARTGVNAEMVVDAGDPPRVVPETAKSVGADLIVVGRGSASGVFGRLRANAYSIIRESPVPVVSV
jgi:nucleotide-binding universal stress UspA family protein